MKMLMIAWALVFLVNSAHAASPVKYVRVWKQQRLMELINAQEKVIKSYPIMLGQNPVGPKVQEGDSKTPEGIYVLDYKNPQSKFHKSIHISYPNQDDIRRARELGVNPGGDIMIHGLPNDVNEIRKWLITVGLEGLGDDIIRWSLPKFDWTDGCIAVLNEEIDEIYQMVSVPTKIIINP